MLKQVQHDRILFVTLNCLGFCFTKSRYSLHFVIVRLTFCSFTSALSLRTTQNPLISGSYLSERFFATLRMTDKVSSSY